eukprot:gene208-376_t
MPRSNISPSSMRTGGDMEVGFRVKAIREKSGVHGKQYNNGVIIRKRQILVYDIQYDDGFIGNGVTRDMIDLIANEELIDYEGAMIEGRSRGSTPRKSGGFPDQSSDAMKNQIRVGTKVEARIKGSTKYFPGIVEHKRLSVTYDITYDNGEMEANVPLNMIRLNDLDGSSQLVEGMRVEARYRGKTMHYPGRIARDNMDGTYAIAYDDGERETAVHRDLIRSTPVSQEDQSNRPVIKLGARVEARYKGGSQYAFGVVTRKGLNITYDINFFDGQRGAEIPGDMVRVVEESDHSHSKGKGQTPRGKTPTTTSSTPSTNGVAFKIDDDVEAMHESNQYMPGRIASDRGDGTYNIEFIDGKRVVGIPFHFIRHLRGLQDSTTPNRRLHFSTDNSDVVKELDNGMKVEVRYQGRAQYYPATITRKRLNGTYDIDYDDGEKEIGVPRELIKVRVGVNNRVSPSRINGNGNGNNPNQTMGGGSPNTARPTTAFGSPKRGAGAVTKAFLEGDLVEAKFEGKGRYLPARITRDHVDGTYDLSYEDGGREMRVPRNMIRPMGSVGAASAIENTSHLFSKGDRAQVNFRGGPKWFAGVISNVNANATIDILYDDGDSEMNVPFNRVRQLSSSADTSYRKSPVRNTNKVFAVGSAVEARFKGTSSYSPGTIARKGADGTYDIIFNDGRTEFGVLSDFIRDSENSSGSKKRRIENGSAPNSAYKQDDRNGNNNGSDPLNPSTEERFQRGDEVEARFKGGAKWFPARITNTNTNGRYHVYYHHQGTEEQNVLPGHIRFDLATKSPYSHDNSYKIGDKVDARFNGEDIFSQGMISRQTGDDVFSVEFDDGRTDPRVPLRWIKRSSNVDARAQGKRNDTDNVNRSSDSLAPRNDSSSLYSAPPSSVNTNSMGFEEGIAVEARFGGGTKYMSGRIERNYGDNTFAIKYDDGSQETRVNGHLIRRAVVHHSEGFQVGDSVKARNGSMGDPLTGVIRRKNLDGTYDIDYSDGRTEFGVPVDLISKALVIDNNNGNGKSENTLEVGTRVEAPYQGGARYFAGVVSRQRLNGTFDITYDDGVKEMAVERALIRVLDRNSAAAVQENISNGHLSHQRPNSSSSGVMAVGGEEI